MTSPIEVGFIGCGIMGSRMAKNLLAANYPVRVFDASRKAMEVMVQAGARACDSPASVATGASVVMLSLPGPQEVREVVAGPMGVLSGSVEGLIVVDLSSVDPGTSRSMVQAASGKGAKYIDCPVSGGPINAEKGTLTLMVGGDEATVNIVRPLLEVIGKKIFHAGPVGAGAAVKLLNNLVIASTMGALAEAFVLGSKVGLSPQTMFNIFSASSAASFQLNMRYSNFIAKRDFSSGFAISLMEKDTKLALEMADQAGVPLILTAVSRELYRMAKARGHGAEDISAVIKVLEEAVGVTVSEDSQAMKEEKS